MPIVNLSANFVSKAVCPEGKKKINYYHKDIRGFLLEVRSLCSSIKKLNGNKLGFNHFTAHHPAPDHANIAH